MDDRRWSMPQPVRQSTCGLQGCSGRRLLGTSLGLLERQVSQGGNFLLVQQVLAAEHAKSAR